MNQLKTRLWNIAGAVSIRVKVLGIVVGMVVLLGFSVTLQVRVVLHRLLADQVVAQGNTIAEGISANIPVLLDDPPTLDAYLEEIKHHYSDKRHNTLVDSVALVDSSGKTVARTAPSTGEQSSNIELKDSIPETDLTLYLSLSEAKIHESVNTVTRQIIYITLGMVVISITASVFLVWFLTRPILNLVDATRAVSGGDFTRRVPRWANDELGDLAEAFNAMTIALAKAEQERATYLSSVITAQEEERKRIARELHDSTSQSLTSLLVGLRHLLEISGLEEMRHKIDDLRKVAAHTLEEVHGLTYQLRPSILDDAGLVTALERYIEDYQQRYPIQIDFVAQGLNRLSPALETAIYRIVQEGLTNVVRHAAASAVSVMIEARPEGIRIIVEDDGKGFDPACVHEHSFGLLGIRERARLFGGKMVIESNPGKGTSLFVELPGEASS